MGEARHFAGTLSSSDQAGLAVAIILHAAVAGLLVLQMKWKTDPPPEPVTQSMTVSLATEVSLESTAPDPVAVARAASAPVVGEEVSEPDEAIPDPAPAERPVPRSTTKPRTQPTKAPRPAATKSPRTPPRNQPKTPPKTNPGSSSFNEAFNRGKGDSPTSQNTGTPATRRGPAELASLENLIGRQVRIKWQGRVPQGPDAEKLVTRVRFKLNPDGSLSGNPQVLETTGVTDLNRNQVGRHQEEAVRAIRLVGRFQVPFEVPDYKNTFTIRFDK